MTRLDAIRQNLLDMDPDQLREHIRKIRADRKIRKEPSAVKKTKAKAQSKTNDKVLKALKGLSEEQIMALLGVELKDEGAAGPTEVDSGEGSSED
jgi:hypothetical protein